MFSHFAYLSLFVSMKLGGTVTYPGLEGMTFCGGYPQVICLVSSDFSGKAGSEVRVWAISSPRLHQQSPPWWEGGLELLGSRARAKCQ